MLFLSGPRDALAELTLLEPAVKKLGERATLHLVDTADHGFKVRKRGRSSTEPVMEGTGAGGGLVDEAAERLKRLADPDLRSALGSADRQMGVHRRSPTLTETERITI